MNYSTTKKEFEFKESIRKRDNYTCGICNIYKKDTITKTLTLAGIKVKDTIQKKLCVHHINYDKKLNIPQNCISLCGSCHGGTHFNKKHWIKFFHSLLSEKYDYSYSENEEIIMEVK